jgi:hypothetical protein
MLEARSAQSIQRVSIEMVHVKVIFRSGDDFEQSSLQSCHIAVPQFPQPEPEVDVIARQTTPFDFALVHNTEHPTRAKYSEAFADHHRGITDVIKGGNTNRAVEGIVSKRKVFGHPKQKRKPILIGSLEEERIDSDVGLPIRQEALIEAGTATKIEDPTLCPDERKEALLKPGTLSLFFREISTVESIEQQQFLPP